MRSVLKLTTAAAVLAGSALFCAPANAAYVGVGVGPIGFDVYSGGYCDRWGCPYNYWTYPIFYGPVYYDNAWYRGPVYTRTINGERWYWVRGGWRRDQWRGPRPSWAGYTHYGPALGLDYYRARGFRVSDENWRAWADRDDRYRGYDQGGTYGNEDRDRGYDMDRDQYRDTDRERGYDRDMDQERGGPDYDRDRGTYEHSGNDRDQYYGRGNENGPDYDRDRGNGDHGYDRDRGETGYDRGNENSGYDRDQGTERPNTDRNRNAYEHSGYDRDRNGYERSDSDRDRGRGTYERSNYEGSGGASGTGHTMHSSTHHTHMTHGTMHHHDMNAPSDRNRGYMHTQYQPDRDRDGMRDDHTRNDMDRSRPDEQSRTHGNSGPSNQNPDQDHSENDSGYKHTSYERPGSPGHAKGPPPSTSHNSTRSHPNPDDENNGPSD